MWVKVAEFCRARESACHGAKPVREIGILYSEAKTPANTQALYTQGYPELYSVRGWIDILQDSGMSTSLLYEYQLEEKLSEYSVFIVPATNKLNPTSIATLEKYARNGGMLIIDRKSLHFFRSLTGIEQTATSNRLAYLDGGDSLAAAETAVTTIECEDACVCSYLYARNIYDDNRMAAALKKEVGGSVIGLAVDLGDVYVKNQSTAIRDFACSLLRALDFKPIVTVRGETSDYVEVILNKKDERLCVNLLNMAGPHAVAQVRSYGQIPPLYDINLSIRSEKRPTEVYATPSDHKLEWSYDNGIITAKLEKLPIHACISIKY